MMHRKGAYSTIKGPEKIALILLASVAGLTILFGLAEYILKQPIRRDYDYYENIAVETTGSGIYFYTTTPVTGHYLGEERVPLGFDEEKQIFHVKAIIHSTTSPWPRCSMIPSGIG